MSVKTISTAFNKGGMAPMPTDDQVKDLIDLLNLAIKRADDKLKQLD